METRKNVYSWYSAGRKLASKFGSQPMLVSDTRTNLISDLNSKMTRHVRPFRINNIKPLKTDVRVIYIHNCSSYLTENKALVHNEDRSKDAVY